MDAMEKEFFKDIFTDVLNGKEGLTELLRQEKGDEGDQIAQESAQVLDLKLKRRQANYVRKVEKALEKMDSGDFGVCEECGDSISFERLKARPTATMCIKCKEDHERGENHMFDKGKNTVYHSNLKYGEFEKNAPSAKEVMKKALIS